MKECQTPTADVHVIRNDDITNGVRSLNMFLVFQKTAKSNICWSKRLRKYTLTPFLLPKHARELQQPSHNKSSSNGCDNEDGGDEGSGGPIIVQS